MNPMPMMPDSRLTIDLLAVTHFVGVSDRTIRRMWE
jgi:hypothetical protein